MLVCLALTTSAATQYCDGLRGPLVVYDPNDPHRHLYDIDDGEPPFEKTSPSLHT